MRPLFSILSPAGSHARLSVLIFHRVVPVPDPLFPGEVDAQRFDDICGWLRRWFQVLPLDQAVQRLRDGGLPARAAAITFDDGYADNHDIAMPILQRHGLSAGFFIASGFLDGGCMWNDLVIDAIRRCALPVFPADRLQEGLPPLPLGDWDARRAAVMQLLRAIKYLPFHARDAQVERIRQLAGITDRPTPMMSSAQLRAMRAAGMVIGAHTVNHPILARLDRAAARAEIADGRAALQNCLQAPVDLFAYPNGKPGEDFSDESLALVREQGFQAAFTTSPGAAERTTDRHLLPRFTPWDRRRWRFGLRLARNLRSA